MSTSSPDDKALAQAIGAEIEYWRGRLGMSREELAAKIGKSKNTIGRYERGDTMPDVPQTWRIAEALNVSVGDLMRRAEEGYQIAANRGKVEPDDESQ